jgi:hypothetical protein
MTQKDQDSTDEKSNKIFLSVILISNSNLRLIKSLGFIIGIQLFGVFFRVLMKLMFNNYWKVDIFVMKTYGLLSTFLGIIVYSVNAPVLYVFR